MILLALPLAIAQDGGGVAGGAPPPPQEARSPESGECPSGTELFQDRCMPVAGDELDVSASKVGDPGAVFEHAGGRSVLDEAAIQKSGATGLGEAMRAVPGVKVVESTGTGNSDTKLNIGVRGLDPRLSARSTLLLDEIPIAVAPYGQPQASLFPVSIFSVSSIDVVRGGASVRFGPQNVGGVINMRTRPIPGRLSAAAVTQTDQWGDTMLGLQVGGTTGIFGAEVEYTPRFGEGYREESAKEIHGGLLKLQLTPSDALRIKSTTHGWYEESELSGGLFPEDFAEDRRQSLRPLDAFSGRRVGSALDVVWQPDADFQAQLLAYSTWSFRRYRLADRPEPDATIVSRMPREYAVFGVEPRVAWRFRLGPTTHSISAGYRRAFEEAHYEETALDRLTGDEELRRDDDAQLAADAAYLEDELSLFGDKLRVNAGLRLEDVRIARRDNLRQELLGADYTALLPAGSVSWVADPRVTAFASYARSFGSPQFLQISLASAEDKLTEEIADTVELGVRGQDLGPLGGELTGFHMRFQDQIEFNDTTFENIGETWHTGVEAALSFWPGYWIEGLDGLEVEVGDTFLLTEIVAGPYAGNEMPYAPRHSVWWEAGWEAENGLSISVDGWWESAQFSDERNTVEENATGSIGLIPAFMVWNLRAGWEAEIDEHWSIDLRAGVKNLFDEDYWYRSDDINAGILPSRARTFYSAMGVRWVQ